MKIQNINNFIAKETNLRKIVTNLNKPGVLLPVILIEASACMGRTYQAYKRGGATEARERATEETLSGIFWLSGVTMFNKIGDVLGNKFLNIPKGEFDLAKDIVRNPLELFLNKNNIDAFKKKVILFKAGKIIASIIGAWIVIGTIIPKFNQAVTRKILSGKKKADKNTQKPVENLLNSAPQTKPKTVEEIKQLINTPKTTSFKGLINIEKLAAFANNLENHAIYKLGATDSGLLISRVSNARNNDERVEIAVRDMCSLYFYYACASHVRKLLNKYDGYEGKLSALNPMATMQIHNELLKIMEAQTSVQTRDAINTFLAEDSAKINQVIKNLGLEKTEIISLEALIKDAEQKGISLNKEKATLMASLQPEKNLDVITGEKHFGAILTKSQLIDVLSDSKMSNPEIIKKVMDETFGKDFSKPYKFISQTEIDKARKLMDDYVTTIVEYAKKHNIQEITAETLSKVNKLNMTKNALNTVAGLGVAALFISTIIPKVQYWITQKRTGKNSFPGIKDFETNS